MRRCLDPPYKTPLSCSSAELDSESKPFIDGDDTRTVLSIPANPTPGYTPIATGRSVPRWPRTDGKKVKAGEKIGAAYIIGWFDDIPEMQRVYDGYKGKHIIVVEKDKFHLE